MNYEASSDLDNGEITASASFSKSMPFSSKLQKVKDGIYFKGKNVAAFGMNELDDKITAFSHILFYKDDDNFVIQLIPEDTINEILLIKGLRNIKTLAEAVEQTKNLIKKGKREVKDPGNSWKYILNDDDQFSIPVVKFNIETDYKSLEGQIISIKGRKYLIKTVYQRTALVLDEKGAKVQSEGGFAADSVPTPLHPKKMVFDKPFFIVMKRIDKENPYFVMKIENSELLERYSR